MLPKGVTGLEIWDLPGADIEFWRRAGTTFVHARRSEGFKESEIGAEVAAEVALVLSRIHAGHYPTRAQVAKGFTRLFLCGGLTVLDGFREALSETELPFAVTFGEGSLGAVMGGRELLLSRGFDSGVIVDVGQSALKLDLVCPRGEEVRIVARDLHRAPIVFEPERIRLGTARLAELGHSSIEFVADVVAEALESRFLPPPRVVLSLPCPLDADLVPGGTTYTHWEGDKDLIPKIVRAIDQRLVARPRLAKCPWREAAELQLWVLNDAEMAALAARKELKTPEKTLVVTLGYGPGAALLQG